VRAQDKYDAAIAAALASPRGEERAAVIREAWSWLGTRWIHESRVKGEGDGGGGVDCGNFPSGVFLGAGMIDDPGLFKYRHDHYKHSNQEFFRDIIERFCDRMGKIAPLPGDLVGFRFHPKNPTICHIAIALAHPTMIHSAGGPWSPDGAVELGDLIGPWARMWSGTWRLRRWAS
jgi:cell wall-associated NlpC family hydrolase